MNVSSHAFTLCFRKHLSSLGFHWTPLQSGVSSHDLLQFSKLSICSLPSSNVTPLPEKPFFPSGYVDHGGAVSSKKNNWCCSLWVLLTPLNLIDNVIQEKCMKLPGLAAAVVAEAPSAIDNYCSSFFSFLLKFLSISLIFFSNLGN